MSATEISWSLFWQDALREVWRELKRCVAGFWQGGWRPLLGFLGGAVAYFSYIEAPKAGIEVNYDAVNVFLGLVLVQALGRGVEKAVEFMRPGIVNPHGSAHVA